MACRPVGNRHRSLGQSKLALSIVAGCAGNGGHCLRHPGERRESESNRRTRLCRPLHDHSAIPPRTAGQNAGREEPGSIHRNPIFPYAAADRLSPLPASGRQAPERRRSPPQKTKGPEGPFIHDLKTLTFYRLLACRSETGAGDETGTRALNPCFPITFFAAVSSEGLNYSLVLRPRQQNSSNNFHQRPRTAISSPDNRRRIHGYQRPAPATPLDTQVSLRQEWHQHRTLRPRLV